MVTDVTSLCSEVSAMAQKAIGMGLEPSVVEKTILEKVSRTGSGYLTLEALIQDCLENAPESDAAKTLEQGRVPLVC